MFAGGHEKSKRMAVSYQTMATQNGAAFLDMDKVIKTSSYDGIHLDVDMQARLGEAVAGLVRGMS